MKVGTSMPDCELPRCLNAFALAILISGAMLVSGSCALLASANASHSGISPCVEDRVYSLIDLGIAVGTGVLIVTDDETSRGWLAVPGVFLASTVLGIIGTHRCRNKNKAGNTSGEYQRSGPVLYRSGEPVPTPETQPNDQDGNAMPNVPKNPLRLSDDYQETILQESCDGSGTKDCPEGYECIRKTASEGRCVPTETKAPDPMGPKSI